MGTNKTKLRIVLTPEEQSELERTARSFAVPHRAVVRAKLILLLAAGCTLSKVGREVGLQRRIVRKWAHRFLEKRLRGLEDDPRSGRPARFSPGGGTALGEGRVRVARQRGPVAVPMDLRRVGSHAPREWGR